MTEVNYRMLYEIVTATVEDLDRKTTLFAELDRDREFIETLGDVGGPLWISMRIEHMKKGEVDTVFFISVHISIAPSFHTHFNPLSGMIPKPATIVSAFFDNPSMIREEFQIFARRVELVLSGENFPSVAAVLSTLGRTGDSTPQEEQTLRQLFRDIPPEA
jgi:hypothetical protein